MARNRKQTPNESFSSFSRIFIRINISTIFVTISLIPLFLILDIYAPIVYAWTYDTIWWLGHSPTASEDQSSGFVRIYYTYPLLVHQNEKFDIGISLEYIRNEKVVTNWLMFNNVSATLRNFSSPEDIISYSSNRYSAELVKPGESYSHVFSFVAPRTEGKYLIFPEWISWFGPGTTVLDNFDWKMEYYYNQTQREAGIIYPNELPPITVVGLNDNNTFAKNNKTRIIGLQHAEPYNQIGSIPVSIEGPAYKAIINLGKEPKNVSLPYNYSYKVTFPKFIDIVPGQVRGYFSSWSDGQSYNQNIIKEDDMEIKGNITRKVTMNSNKEIFAIYKTQYKLDVVSPNNLGNPKGTGWYESGTQALFSVNGLEGLTILPIPKSFDRWTDDISAEISDTSASGHMIMDSPKKITANWKDDYTLLGVGLGIAASGIGVVEFARRFYSEKR